MMPGRNANWEINVVQLHVLELPSKGADIGHGSCHGVALDSFSSPPLQGKVICQHSKWFVNMTGNLWEKIPIHFRGPMDFFS